MFGHLDDASLGDRLAARTLEIVDVPSVSRDEAALHAHLLGLLRAGGVAARDAGDTAIVAELPGPADAPVVVLAGHYDTVPVQGNLPGRRDGEAVHGCGASDMKAAVALMCEIALAAAAGDAPTTARVRICLFGREELPFDETALSPLLAREPALTEADVALVMEPTDNAVHAGCLGNLNATWTFHGRAGHSARPWDADNAIVRAAHGIAALAGAAPPEAHVIDGLEFTEVVSVTQISGGVARNVIPDEVVCGVNARYAPDRSAADAEERLRALCAVEGSTLAIDANAPSGAVAVGHPLVRRLIETGVDVAPKQAWTPVAEFALAGVPAVNFGPGAPRWAHQRAERVEVAALVRCARILDGLLCG